MLRLLLPALRRAASIRKARDGVRPRAQSSVTGGADRGDGHDAGVQARQAVLRLAAEQNIGPSLEDLQHKFAVRSARAPQQDRMPLMHRSRSALSLSAPHSC